MISDSRLSHSPFLFVSFLLFFTFSCSALYASPSYVGKPEVAKIVVAPLPQVKSTLVVANNEVPNITITVPVVSEETKPALSTEAETSNNTVAISSTSVNTSVSATSVQESAPVPVGASGKYISERRENIAYYAISLQGIRYKTAGRSTNGFDCSGFTSYVFQYFDYKVNPYSGDQAKMGEFVYLADTRPGDLIFFSHNGKTIGHVAVVTRNEGNRLYVAHATCSKGIIEQEILQDPYWSQRIKYARNIIGD